MGEKGRQKVRERKRIDDFTSSVFTPLLMSKKSNMERQVVASFCASKRAEVPNFWGKKEI